MRVVFTRKVFVLVFLSGALASCAYFNTFYNAQRYFEKAEDELSSEEDRAKPKKQTMDALKNTIEKCQKVLAQYPESRFRDDCLLLMGKAHYYRGEYSSTKETLEELLEEEESPLRDEASLWLLRSSWKLGNSDVALSELKHSFSRIGEKRLKPMWHEAIAEIYLDRGELDSAIVHLEKATQFLKDRMKRSEIYYRIAELAFSKSAYETSARFYRKVIGESASSKHIEQAHLQLVKCFRLQRQWDRTAEEIRNLLTSEKFSAIRPELNLELAKLYENEGQLTQAMNRYSIVTEEFPKTKSSAEAYFRLGSLTLATSNDFEQARKYFEKVDKEKGNSLYSPSAKVKVKEIDTILRIQKELQELQATLVDMRHTGDQADLHGEPSSGEDKRSLGEPDSVEHAGIQSTALPVDSTQVLEELGDKLYSYGELLAFHFHHPDSGLKVFERLIMQTKQSSKRAQAMYSASYLYQLMGDTVSSLHYADALVEEYPFSRYAEKVLMDRGEIAHDPALNLLLQAEMKSERNVDTAIVAYTRLVADYPSSRFAPVALLAIAYLYDHRLHDLTESLNSYERLVEKYPDSEQARSALSRYNRLKQIQASLLAETTAADSAGVESKQEEPPEIDDDRRLPHPLK